MQDVLIRYVISYCQWVSALDIGQYLSFIITITMYVHNTQLLIELIIYLLRSRNTLYVRFSIILKKSNLLKINTRGIHLCFLLDSYMVQVIKTSKSP